MLADYWRKELGLTTFYGKYALCFLGEHESVLCSIILFWIQSSQEQVIFSLNNNKTRGPTWSYIAQMGKQNCTYTIEFSPKFTALRFLYKFYVQEWHDGPELQCRIRRAVPHLFNLSSKFLLGLSLPPPAPSLSVFSVNTKVLVFCAPLFSSEYSALKPYFL